MLNTLLTNQLELAERDRAEIMARAISYYEGLGPSRMLITRPGDPDDNLAIGYASTIVDKGASFLFGASPDIEIKGVQGDEEAGERYLDQVWEEEMRAVDLLELATNGGIFGHAWVKIATSNGLPTVLVLDPQNMSAEWDPRNYRQIWRYRNQYNTVDERGEPIIWREDTERMGRGWIIQEFYSRPDKTNWIPAGPPIEWPYEFAPIFECKNLPKASEFYGKADLCRPVLALCHYIARVDSLINRIIRVHAYPKPVAKGMREQDLKVGTDQILFLPQVEQDLKLLEMTGDLTAAMNFRKQLREALAEISQVPEIATGKIESVGQLSGLALKILYGPLLDRTYTKQKLYGRMIKQIVRALLVIGQVTPDAQINLKWPSPLPGDDRADAETAILKKQVGVSEESLLRELGYDPDDEKAKTQAAGDALADKLLTAFDRNQQ